VLRSDSGVGKDHLEMYARVGIRAVQSTPLMSRWGRMRGMISTHWREPHEPLERDLRLFDLLARQAADLIERARGEQQLRESEEDLRRANQMKDEFLDDGLSRTQNAAQRRARVGTDAALRHAAAGHDRTGVGSAGTQCQSASATG
jgi:GAF domain-containing protein